MAPSRNPSRRHRSPNFPVLPSAAACCIVVATSAIPSPLHSGRGDLRDGAAGGLDGRLGTLGGADALERDLLAQRAGEDDLGRQRVGGHEASLLEHQQVDFADRQLVQFGQAHFDIAPGHQRDETTLRQTPLHRHLTAFETDLVEATGARSLALVTKSASLAQTGTDPATNALGRLLAALGAHNPIEVNKIYGDIKYIQFFGVGVIMMAIFTSTMFGGGIALIRDREAGIHEGYLVTPVQRTSIIAGIISSGTVRAFIAERKTTPKIPHKGLKAIMASSKEVDPKKVIPMGDEEFKDF